MGQTFNLIFDEPYGNEQKINSVSAWNALVHFFAELTDVGFPEDVKTRRRTFLSFFLNFNVRPQNSTLRQFALQFTHLGSCNNSVVD